MTSEMGKRSEQMYRKRRDTNSKQAQEKINNTGVDGERLALWGNAK